MKKLRIIVGGFLGLLPAGGVTWDYVQYPVGFAELGHDVFYIEDTKLYPFYKKEDGDWNDSSLSVEHLQRVMEFFGMSERWAYRDEASGKCFGISEEEVKEIARTADIFVNISCSTVMRDEYRRIPARVLIDSDPMFTQIQYLSEQMFTPGASSMRGLVDAHNYLFTFGENIGAADCRIPTCGLNWRPTRQPVCLDYWKATPPNKNGALTTVMNWAVGKNLSYDREEWGQKDVEFSKFIELPKSMPGAVLAVAVTQTSNTGADAFPIDEVKKNGWQVLNPDVCAGNSIDYQNFIKESLGEFSVAKQTYVKGRTGWFSCRSACYLAAGRPVVTQDTGWSRYIPTGDGLFSFEERDEAVEAIKQIKSEPEKHSQAARGIADEYFDSRKVLDAILKQLV
ncbi:MAG: hypothetical protein M3367_09795 [Acidobacteriota bacterium]|nr:hypothetical protein [Acidobacteriota bacterium]